MRQTVSPLKEIQIRLTIFRRTLMCLTEKALLAGGEDSAPREIAYQLNQTRIELARLERKLADIQHTTQAA